MARLRDDRLCVTRMNSIGSMVRDMVNGQQVLRFNRLNRTFVVIELRTVFSTSFSLETVEVALTPLRGMWLVMAAASGFRVMPTTNRVSV